MIVFLALGSSRVQQTMRDIEYLRAEGLGAMVVTVKSSRWPEELLQKAQVVELAPHESRSVLVRGERFLVFRLPRYLLRLLRRVGSVGLRLIGRDEAAYVKRVESMMAAQRSWSDRFHRERFSAWYRRVRPYVLWRAGRRSQLMKVMASEEISQVVVTDSLSVPLGWHVARACPNLPVSFYLKRAAQSGSGERG